MKARKALAGLSLAVSAGLLAGCATELPQPQPDPPAETPPPALDEERLERILGEIQTTVDEADAADDPELLGSRVVGPAAEARAAEYALARATDGEVEPDTLVTDPQVAAVPATDTWPRPAMVVTEIPEGENLPLLLTLVQAEPRDPYALWGWVTLFPGIEVPGMARPEAGSAVVPADAEGLAASPQDVVARYVDVLNNGDESEHADAFADDPYRQTSAERVSSLTDSVEGFGEGSGNAEVGDDGPLALATAEGGAIVMGEVRRTLTLTRTVADSSITAGPPFDILLDDPEVVGSVTATFDVMVAFRVPPQDAEDTTIRPIGATEVLVDASRDDSVAPE